MPVHATVGHLAVGYDGADSADSDRVTMELIVIPREGEQGAVRKCLRLEGAVPLRALDRCQDSGAAERVLELDGRARDVRDNNAPHVRLRRDGGMRARASQGATGMRPGVRSKGLLVPGSRS